MSVMVMSRMASVASDPKVAPISGMASASTSRSTPGALPPRVGGMVAVGVSQSVPHLIRGCSGLTDSLSGRCGGKSH